MELKLNDFARSIFENAKDKGFHSLSKSEDEFIEKATNNLHDEISELHEAWRKGQLRELCDKNIPVKLGRSIDLMNNLEEELADIIIRTLDMAHRLNVNIEEAVKAKHEYNKTRPHRHGGKKS